MNTAAITQDNTPAQDRLGHKGLQFEEPLLFEQGGMGKSGVDLPAAPKTTNRLGGMQRKNPARLAALSEPEVVRHFTRLSQKNYSIDSGFYPLGSCTMKHNPRLNEKMARLDGFAAIHPLQPLSTVPGALLLMQELTKWLCGLTGMAAVALSPAAGAHGELCGVMAIKAALQARGESQRVKILVPASAHGTNPATAASCGFTVQNIAATAAGTVDVPALLAALDDTVAGVMITNPNTCGLFEQDFRTIADAVHQAGGYVYCDGANYNAVVGQVNIAALGVDCMHINLHKTFSTPHGGGGPGSGPVVLSAALAPYAPRPVLLYKNGAVEVLEQATGEAAESLGRIKAYFGQFGTFVRAVAYMMALGIDGLKQASTDAVLNANYVRVRLQDEYSVAFNGICMHEVLFSDKCLKDTNVSTLDIAKALIDKGFHPMTVYFPLVVSGAMLIEPTETESKQTLDEFIAAMRSVMQKAKEGDTAYFAAAPQYTPRRRLDETTAARKPILRYHYN